MRELRKRRVEERGTLQLPKGTFYYSCYADTHLCVTPRGQVKPQALEDVLQGLATVEVDVDLRGSLVNLQLDGAEGDGRWRGRRAAEAVGALTPGAREGRDRQGPGGVVARPGLLGVVQGAVGGVLTAVGLLVRHKRHLWVDIWSPSRRSGRKWTREISDGNGNFVDKLGQARTFLGFFLMSTSAGVKVDSTRKKKVNGILIH